MPEAKEVLFKPVELYNNSLRKTYHNAAEQYFAKLAKDSNTDVNQNAMLVKAYNEACEKTKEASSQLAKLRSKKGGRITLSVFMFIFSGIMIFFGLYNLIAGDLFGLDGTAHVLVNAGLIIGAAALITLGVFNIIWAKRKYDPLIKDASDLVAKLKAAEKEALSKCYDSMKNLNNILDWNMPAIVMERCTPIIDLDPIFSVQRFKYLYDKFGINMDGGKDTSLVGVLTGNIQGNPFVLARFFDCDYRPKVYHGELTITWTTTYRDSKGNIHTVTHTQTLHATATHDAPFYGGVTKLIYGNDAAPNLSFTRSPSGGAHLKEKERERFVEKKMKEIHKKADKAITSGGTFTALGNDEFDVLFNALNRDNEVEYRLLFTPLAQRNEIDLLTTSPFGDDFSFYKRKKVNVIISSHSQGFDYSANPEKFIHYDFKAAQDIFVNYCDSFIEHLYFDLAPIISIPQYQMHKTLDYIYDRPCVSNISPAEHEVIANGFDKACFIPDGADSSLPLLLKTKFLSKNEGFDNVNVHAYSYHTTPMVDYIPVRGGDGHIHNVPVHWTKYDRVDSDNIIQVKSTNASRHEYRSEYAQRIYDMLSGAKDGVRFERGLFGIFLKRGYSKEDDEKISSIFDKK